MAIQVHPSLLDKEVVTLFANMLKTPYYQHMTGSLAEQFIDIVVVAEHIKQGIWSGRISTPTKEKGC